MMKEPKANIVDLSARRIAKARKRVRCPMATEGAPVRWHTIERWHMDGQQVYNVYGWRERPDQKALRMQDPLQNIVATFDTQEAAVKAYPSANVILARRERSIARSPWPEETEKLRHRSLGIVDGATPKSGPFVRYTIQPTGIQGGRIFGAYGWRADGQKILIERFRNRDDAIKKYPNATFHDPSTP
jgi:hypothetical protein